VRIKVEVVEVEVVEEMEEMEEMEEVEEMEEEVTVARVCRVLHQGVWLMHLIIIGLVVMGCSKTDYDLKTTEKISWQSKLCKNCQKCRSITVACHMPIHWKKTRKS